MIYALCWTIKSRFYRRFDEANFLIRMKKCSEKFCFLRHRIMKTVVFPNILVSLGQNKNISMKTVARTFLLLSYVAYKVKQHSIATRLQTC